MGCPGGPRDGVDMEVSAKPQEDKSIDWLDLEFWPESDFKVEAMQSNQHFDWVSQPVGTSDEQHMHSTHHPPPPVAQEHHLGAANGDPLAVFVQPREEESMPIIEPVRTTWEVLMIHRTVRRDLPVLARALKGHMILFMMKVPANLQEEQAELLGAISGQEADMSLSYVGLEPHSSHNHLSAAELDQRDILYGSAFTLGGSSETHGAHLAPHSCLLYSTWHHETILEIMRGHEGKLSTR